MLVLVLVSVAVDARFFAYADGAPSLTLTELLVLAASGVWAASLTRSSELRRETVRLVREGRLVVVLFGVSLIAVVVSALWSVDGLRIWKDFFPSLMVYFLVLRLSSRYGGAWVARGYVMAMIIPIVLGFSQMRLGGPRPASLSESSIWKMNVEGVRIGSEMLATGFYPHPNMYALSILPVLLISLGLVAGARRGRWRALGAAVFLLGVWTLWGAAARGGMLWLGIGIALFALSSMLARGRAFAAGLSILVVWIGLPVLLVGRSSLGFFNFGSVDTLQTRMWLWQAGVETLQSNLRFVLLGGGRDRLWQVSGGISNLQYASSHNTFLDFAVYFGLPVLLLYTILIVRTISRASTLRRAAGAEGGVSSAVLLAALSALTGALFFEPALQGATIQAHLFFLIGLIDGLYVGGPRRPR